MDISNSFRSTNIIVVILLWLSCVPQYAFSQAAAKDPVIKFAGIDTRVIKTRTYEQVLASPAFECSDGYKVNRFKISFLNTEENNFYGPYTVNGPKVTGEPMEVLQKLSNIKATPLKITLDGIRVVAPDTTMRVVAGKVFNIVD